MRYGILGDIHANLEALTAVLDACKKESLAQCFCVGDIVGYAANPAECISTIKALATVTVAGNHDWAVGGLLGIDYFNFEAGKAICWTSSRLKSTERDFLLSLKLVYRNTDLTLVHGTLDNPEAFDYMLNVYSSRSSFQLLDNNICFIGHSHLPDIFIQDKDSSISRIKASRITIEEGKKYIINVGSVGQPRDGDSRACYCIYDTTPKEVVFKRVAYDIEAARGKIIKAGLPKILGDRLLSGV